MRQSCGPDWCAQFSSHEVARGGFSPRRRASDEERAPGLSSTVSTVLVIPGRCDNRRIRGNDRLLGKGNTRPRSLGEADEATHVSRDTDRPEWHCSCFLTQIWDEVICTVKGKKIAEVKDEVGPVDDDDED